MTGDQLTAVFGALADPTRRAILARLTEGDASVAELAAPFRVSQPAISRHLKVLERAGLISRERRATARLSHLEAEPLREATEWLARYRDTGTRVTTASTTFSRRCSSPGRRTPDRPAPPRPKGAPDHGNDADHG